MASSSTGELNGIVRRDGENNGLLESSPARVVNQAVSAPSSERTNEASAPTGLK